MHTRPPICLTATRKMQDRSSASTPQKKQSPAEKVKRQNSSSPKADGSSITTKFSDYPFQARSPLSFAPTKHSVFCRSIFLQDRAILSDRGIHSYPAERILPARSSLFSEIIRPQTAKSNNNYHSLHKHRDSFRPFSKSTKKFQILKNY